MAAEFGTREGFLKVYEELKEEIVTAILPEYDMPEELKAYTREMLDYNVPGGKLNRGLTVVHALQALRGAELPAEDAKAAAVLGWCIEWLQAFFLIADDIMDASVTRRGSPCWYKLPKVGMIAINDGFLLQAHMFKILERHFGGKPYYGSLLQLFIETTFQTELGQELDLTSQPLPGAGEIDLDRFTEERYKLIVKYKTAFYSFFLPVACGLVLAGYGSAVSNKTVRDILLQMGEYFQIQDDYLDCYADAAVLGKIGTDIQDNKCSWLVVQALKRATPEQRAFLKEHYGKHNDASIAAVKKLYAEMGLEPLFLSYEQESYASLTKMIAEATAATGIPDAVFTSLLGKIYKRAK